MPPGNKVCLPLPPRLPGCPRRAAPCCARSAPAGTREGVLFLREHGVPIPLAQRVADRWGPQTRAVVERDPYDALSGMGLAFT